MMVHLSPTVPRCLFSCGLDLFDMIDLHYVYFLTFNISINFDLLSSGGKEPLFRLSDFLFVFCTG